MGFQIAGSAQPTDYSGNDRDLTQVGTTPDDETGSGKFIWGYDASSFNNTTDFLERTNPTGLDFTGDLTIFLRFRFTSSGSNNVLGHGHSGGGTNNNRIYTVRAQTASGGLIRFQHTDSSQVVHNMDSSTGLFTNGEEYSVWITRELSTRNLRIGVDSVLVGNVTYGVGDDANDGADGHLTVGCNSPTFTSLPTDGVYEVRIWDELISEDILNQLSDPDDYTYNGRLVGGEEACYFLGHVAGMSEAL